MASNASYATYWYRPLDSVHGCIRVLKFVEGTAGSPLVHCELQQVALDDFTLEFADFLGSRSESAMSFLATRDWHRLHAAEASDECRNPPVISIPGWTPPAGTDVSLPKWGRKRRDPLPRAAIKPRFRWGDFKAISYCWESDVKEKEIVLHGHRMKIPKNLEAVLQRLRRLPESQSGTMKFWIDAICIDQDSIGEKNQQVRIMHEIYAAAFSLIVWLGEATVSSGVAIDTLVQMDYVRDEILWKAAEDHTGACADWIRKFYEPWCRSIDWHGVSDFLTRPYWTRVWIIQELALNHHDTMFLCGEKQLQREVIGGAVDFCFELFRQVGSILDKAKSRETGSRVFTNTWQLDLFSASFGVGTLVRLNALQLQQGGIDYVLDLSQRARAKDPRDKVFALLGLLPDGLKERMRADYAATVSRDHVYAQMAKSLLQYTNRLDSILSWCHHPHYRALPSWVPDWEVKFPRNSVQHLKRRCASFNTSSVWSLSNDGKLLFCKGLLVDELVGLSSSPSESIPHREIVPELPAKREPPLPHQYGDIHGLGLALERTLVADHPRSFCSDVAPVVRNIYWIDWHFVNNTDPNNPFLISFWRYMTLIIRSTHWEAFDRFRQTNVNWSVFGHPLRGFFPGMHDYKPPPFSWSRLRTDPVQRGFTEIEATGMAYTCLSLAKRRLATTRKGYLGAVPEDAEVGDKLVILYGCNFPVVLRCCGENYRVVGEAYVDGLMNGEAIQARDRGEYSERLFALC